MTDLSKIVEELRDCRDAWLREEVGSDGSQDALDRYSMRLVARAPTLLAAASEGERLREVVKTEPELPGDMPSEMWAAIRDAMLDSDEAAAREAFTEILRSCVRCTKASILERAALTESEAFTMEDVEAMTYETEDPESEAEHGA